MDHFKVLPTDERFKNLTVDQINILLYGMQEKSRREAIAQANANGEQVVSTSSFNDLDDSWQYSEDFDPTDGAGEEDLLKQVKDQQSDNMDKMENVDTLEADNLAKQQDKYIKSKNNETKKTISKTIAAFTKK
ncbi:RNA polymerase beta subunit [Lactobacillus phage 521B]|jgi:hypothetical protein|uniref:Tail protein n=1 Tax=Lactobacillus phage 521B TaxID=2510942 RepID=A0A4Y5FEL3_9CAUD|nr:RNA polymerase beta subunit [Lactobacillus phage 521B]QBJ03485.1 tail protein [Lactobacillus phage 521B]